MIIVVSYYQSLAVKLAPISEQDQFLWKSLLLCVEMVLFAMMLHCTFPISEFMGGIPDRRVMSNMKDLFAVNDLFEGFEHNFKPEYVLLFLLLYTMIYWDCPPSVPCPTS